MVSKKKTSKSPRRTPVRRANQSVVPVLEPMPIQETPAPSGSNMTVFAWVLAILVVGGFFLKDKTGCKPALKAFPVKFVNKVEVSELKGGPYSASFLCAAGKDRVAVSDEAHTRVLVVGLDGKLLNAFGHAGKERSELHHVTGISSDSDGNLYVLDHETADIFGFHQDGKKFMQVDSRLTGYYYGPRGLCYMKGDFAIADTGSCRIVVVDSTGKTVLKWGERGNKPDQLSAPNAVWVDAKGRFIVSDGDNKRVKIFDAKGKLLNTIEVPEKPAAIASDGKNHLFVSFGNELFVKVYSLDSGRYEGDLSVTNLAKDDNYRNISAMCVVDGDKLVTSDVNTLRVYQFD